MRTFWFVVILATPWLVGCDRHANLRRRDASTELTSIPVDFHRTQPARSDPGPSPELSAAIDRDEARPAGPITEERFRSWWSCAELRVLIESQKGKVQHVRELLKLADESEQEFLNRIGAEPLYSGESPAFQLKVFQLIRRRVERELENATRQLNGLQRQVAQFELKPKSGAATTGPTKRSQPFSHTAGDQVMTDQPISSLGLSQVQIRRLEQRGVRTAGDLARDFCLPEQHELLAQLLEMDLESVKQLVRQATAVIPQAELDSLIQEAHKPRAFGVLPPESSDERNKAP